MNARVAIINGIRTPFCRAGGVLNDLQADDLGAFALKELFIRAPFEPHLIDEVILGNVLSPPHAANIARVIAVKAGLPVTIPAFTVNRNCASGMEAVISGALRLELRQAEIVLAGGVESMSHFPLQFPDSMRHYLQALKKTKGTVSLIKALFALRPSLFKPQIPELSDPLCGLSMGQTAERIIREFHITREAQDQFALESQIKAAAALTSDRFAEEIVPIPLPPDFKRIQESDDGPRLNQTLEALQQLKPVFEPLTGSVTAGNSSQVTDGAAVLLLMQEEKARALGLTPLGYLKAYATSGLEPARMGLGPAYATAKLLDKTGMRLEEIDLIEINEAFAGQVLAVMKALESDTFAKQALQKEKAVGSIDPDKLNVNGGAIALGHPLGASGARLLLTLLYELKKRQKKWGLATLCVGGGQGQACLVEGES